MSKLSKWFRDLKPGLRKLLNFLICLSPSPKSTDVGDRAEALPPSIPGREGTDQIPTPNAPGKHAAAITTPSSAARPDAAPTAPPPKDAPCRAGASEESAGPQVQVRDEQSPLDADALAAVKDGVRGAEAAYKDASHVGDGPSDVVQHVTDGAAGADKWFELVNGLFDKISAFSNFVSAIGEVHEYAKMAATLIQAALKPILAQKARDDALKELIDDMAHAYDVVMAHQNQFEGVKDDEHDPRCKLLARLAQQTGACAMFIQQHYDAKSFLKRAWKTTLDFEVDKMIVEYRNAFKKLGQMITAHDIPQIIDIVTAISITASRIEATLMLQELKYAEDIGRKSGKACLPGTRTATIDNLVDWIIDPDGTRARFVIGVAGSGKSSIAHTIASRLEALGQLGAFFAFDRNNKDLEPRSLFSTLARDLADWNKDFRREICAVLSTKARLAKSSDVIEQWENLIVRPAQKAHWVGPVVIVVDAFDECTDLTETPSAFARTDPDLLRQREHLLKALTERVGDLPANFRVLVTSRLEPDVATALRNHSSTIGDKTASLAFDHIDLSLKEHDPTESISVYIRHETKPHLDDEQIRALVVAADGLFEWAATVCRLLSPKIGGSTVAERYKKWLEAPSAFCNVGLDKLETLYAEILSQQFPDEMGIDRFRSVMAQVLYSAEPVSMDTLTSLRRGADASDGAVELIIPHLGSLLSGVGDPLEPIRPLHTSFRDFLTRADPPHAWHVAPGDVHGVMALGALRVLNQSLHFDMWSFPSSYTTNEYIHDVDNRMKKLPAGLVYANQHWTYHLSMASTSAVTLQTELRIFLTQKLLFWLEVVSLCGFMHRAVPHLLTAASFLKPLHDDDAIAFINDAVSFVNIFIDPIRDSVPHIYLSALAFCPTTSLIRRTFVRNSSLLPAVDGLAAAWPVVLCPYRVQCLASSPDGTHIALGCLDGAVRLLEAENMHKTVLELSRAPGSSTGVSSIAFSPDGQTIAAAAATGDSIPVIFRWNAKTGEMLGVSHGHTDWINSLCFSPDGRDFVSASDDQTVRRWDANTGKQIGDSLRGHTGWVLSVLCSLNSDSIISAGDDATIRIWNADTGQQDGASIYPPGQRPLRMSLARSPKSNLIAVGMISEDSSSVWVFDIDQRCFVRELARRHRIGLPINAWSYDGRHIASAFNDGTIRLWDGFDSSSIALYTRTTSVEAILFSPDGYHVIMKLYSGNLHTVDISAAQSQSSQYDTGSAEYAAYSPDGQYAAVTFQGKKFPSVWDAKTGASISDDRVLTASLTWLKEAMDRSFRHYDQDGWGERNAHRPHDIVSANGLRSAGVWFDEISIWDSASQTLLRPNILISSSNVTCVVLSPLGDCVLQGSSDGTVRIFHVDQSADNIPLPDTNSVVGKQRYHVPEGEHSMPVLRPGRFTGWLYDNNDQHIIYVPEQYRALLWLPGLVHIFRPNGEPVTPRRIDVSGVGLGTEWTRCAGALSVDLGNAPMSSEPVAND